MTGRALAATMRQQWHDSRIRTHYEGCEMVHAACAIERLCDEVVRLTAALDLCQRRLHSSSEESRRD